jgi:hypothetical protein
MSQADVVRLLDLPVSRRTTLRAAVALGLGGQLVAGGIRAASAQDAEYPELTLVATEYAFDMPATAESGFTRLTLDNQGAADHHAMFFRINDDATPDDFQQAMMTGDPFAVLQVAASHGGPMADPGGKGSVILDLTPGMYMVVCLIPDEEGTPHAAHGMVAPLEVTEGASEAVAPETSAAVSLVEMSFEGLPAEATAGAVTWEVTNNGEQVHEMYVARLMPGMTFDMLMSIMMSEGESATPMAMEATPAASPAAMGPPFVGIGGIAPMSPGMTNYAELVLEPGEHFAICFVPDPETGMPHYMMGMVAPFTVA